MPSEIYWHPSTTFWTWQNKYPYHFPTYYKGIQVRDKLGQKKKKNATQYQMQISKLI